RQILLGDFRHRDVQHIEILLAYQIEQEVQRPFEGLEKDFKCVGRNVEILRYGEQGLAVKARQRHAVNDVGRAVYGWIHERVQFAAAASRGHLASISPFDTRTASGELDWTGILPAIPHLCSCPK